MTPSDPTREALTDALSVLRSDAVDPQRAAMWRYGVRHTLSVIEAALAALPGTPQPILDYTLSDPVRDHE